MNLQLNVVVLNCVVHSGGLISDFFIRMICCLWKWAVCCTTWASREPSRCCASTTMSPTVCGADPPTRWGVRGPHSSTRGSPRGRGWFVFVSMVAELVGAALKPNSVFVSPEQRQSCRDLPVDQPPRDGVAALRRPGRVRAQPQGQRGPRRTHGTREQGAWAPTQYECWEFLKSSLLGFCVTVWTAIQWGILLFVCVHLW